MDYEGDEDSVMRRAEDNRAIAATFAVVGNGESFREDPALPPAPKSRVDLKRPIACDSAGALILNGLERN
jgi:hypothetical protein